MRMIKKRKYNAAGRKQQAGQTRQRILDAARLVVSRKGFAEATFEAIAAEAGVAVPTVYAAFGSKSRIMQELMGRATFSEDYGKLVRESNASNDPETRLRIAAKIARGIFDSLRCELEVLRGAAAIAPEFIREREQVRYERQSGLIQFLKKREVLRPGITASMARDILWTLTSHDVHRRLVVERKWSSDRYEEWLGDTLVATLLVAPNKKGSPG
ncbi:MAG TPA: TetR/AcrR family transcriptional regulator [Candidatus Sulfotelmatobacter sp.]|nr:TetR/AcrR family transcriptional regulator [Candidatus Sulfotelmatobacter sp.]